MISAGRYHEQVCRNCIVIPAVLTDDHRNEDTKRGDIMRLLNATALVAAGVMATAAGYTTATAQGTYTPRFSGMVQSSVAGCPAIAWRIGQSPTGALHGVMWFNDMSGMSQVDGSANGKQFSLSLRSIMGNGPVGTVTGTVGVGARLTGTGCANATFRPIVVNNYGGGG
jgi:hypothetical protein